MLAPSTETAPAGLPDFSGDTDADLFGYMAMATEDLCAAKGAFAEFYRRYTPRLLRNVRNAGFVGLLGLGEQDVYDLVQETMLRAFQKAKQLDINVEDPAELPPRIIAWLNKIANRLALLARRRLVPVDLLDGREDTLPAASDGDLPESAECEAMRDALDSLPPREREVVLVTMYHWKPGAEQQRLPNAVSAALMEQLQTSQANIRAIRKRALEKLEIRYAEFLRARTQSQINA